MTTERGGSAPVAPETFTAYDLRGGSLIAIDIDPVNRTQHYIHPWTNRHITLPLSDVMLAHYQRERSR